MLTENYLLTAELQGPPSDPLDWKDWVNHFRDMLDTVEALSSENDQSVRLLAETEDELALAKTEIEDLKTQIYGLQLTPEEKG